MRHTRTARGSVLLLVVGLLTIIAMLGGTFLLVARFEARTSRALADKGTADPVAQGVVAYVQEAIKSDLRLSTNGPYESKRTGVASLSWKDFADYGSSDSSAGIDAIIYGNRTTQFYSEQFYSEIYGTSSTKVDADGDGTNDAYLVDTGARSVDGYRYYAAVKVTDMSSLLNVNTAGSPAVNPSVSGDELPAYSAPVNVDFLTYLSSYSGLYNNIHAARCNNTAALLPLATFNANSALRVLSPAAVSSTNYRPFAIGDEVCLRWLGTPAPTETGRLYTLANASSLPIAYRKYLTTYSASRSRPRNPDAAFQKRILLSDITSTTGTVGSDSRQRLYDELVKTGATNSAAAHFVANLWAYLTLYADTLTNTFAFTPSGLGTTVYGQVRQPFITEAYAGFVKETSVDAGDHKWFAAVELFNPHTDTTIDLTKYKLGGTALTGTLTPSSRRVFFNHNCANDSDAASTFSLTLTGWTHHNATDLEFYGGGNVQLVRVVGTTDILADYVTAADLEHDADAPASTDETSDAQRDDNAARARYSVAVYTTGLTPTMGAANTADTTQITLNTCYAGFSTTDIVHGAPANIGYLSNVYYTGPETGKDLPHQLKDFKTTLSRAKAEFRGDVAAGTGVYPDVPWAALLGELLEQVPTDSTRTDDTTRIYGRVNINTADYTTLYYLPWSSSITLSGTTYNSTTTPSFKIADLIAQIIAYRDKTKTGVYASARATASGITGLRADTNSNIPGFLTPGELAIPIGDYVNTLIGLSATPDLAKYADYRDARDQLYRDVSNLITVNSDTYAVNILVELGTRKSDVARNAWRYLAVIDRSNCKTASDTPAVLLFTELK